MIKTIDKNVCRVLRQEIDEALKSISTKHDISIHAGSASFTSSSVTFKVEIAVKGEGGMVINRDAEDFKRYCGMYGFLEEDLGKTFVSNGNEYRICGLSTRSSKFPILAEHTGSKKVFKFPENVVLKRIGKGESVPTLS
jgi:hypothetical protein